MTDYTPGDAALERACDEVDKLFPDSADILTDSQRRKVRVILNRLASECVHSGKFAGRGEAFDMIKKTLKGVLNI